MSLRSIHVCFCLAGCSVALSSSAFGQEPTDPNEQLIYQAYSNLQLDSTYELRLTGTQTIAGQTRRFASTLTWNCGTTAQVALDDYDTTGATPRFLRHYVGDGTTLWFYDFVNQRYSAMTYGKYGPQGPNPQTDAPRLFAQLYAEASGPSAYLVRLMREVNPPTGGTLIPRYQTWAPGYLPGQPPTTPPIQDPIFSSQWYADAGNTIYVLYGPNPILFYPPGPPNNVPPTRSVAFQLLNSEPSNTPANYHLVSVFFAEKGPNRLVDWTLELHDPATITSSNMFKPYTPSYVERWQRVPPPRATN